VRNRLLFCVLVLLMSIPASAGEDVVINEIYYNPLENDLNEFIELYNPTTSPIDLDGYHFTAGITYTFPPGTTIEPEGYLVLARDPQAFIWWRDSSYKVGPYEGKLINSGERLTLAASDGRIVDSVTYRDFTPWPRGADGYGSSLERISPDLPSEDFHTWRGSLSENGTPGRRNSTIGVPPSPVVTAVEFTPQYPTSRDDVQVEVSLDGPELIQAVVLQYETLTNASTPLISVKTEPMSLQREDPRTATFTGTIPAQDSQTLVRCNFRVTLDDGSEIVLPHTSEPRPFESYFVYNNEIPADLPILWMFTSRSSSKLPEDSRPITAAVIKEVDSDHVQVFDGARIYNSRSGQKLKFLKYEEYRGDRTLNILPEVPRGGTTSGGQAPHVEHISHGLFEDFGVLTVRCDWFRVIEGNQHTQRLSIEQPNERFMEINDRDPNANIYKIAYNEPNRYPYLPGRINYTKQTNTDEGVEDLYEFFGAINSDNPDLRAKALRRFLVVEEVMGYSVAGVLMSNWDGFFNNMFLIHNPPPIDRWECVPWDLDKTFGFTDSDHMFVEMPLEFPLNGQARRASREPGPVSRPFHMDPEFNQEYLKRVRAALDGLFSIERVTGLMNEIETLLLDDLALLEEYTGQQRNGRREQIVESYDTMETFLHLRHDYLRDHLPAPVSDWTLY